jgi:hypothetical protein
LSSSKAAAAPRHRPGRGSAVLPNEKQAIQHLSLVGLSANEISRRLGRSPAAIRRVLSGPEMEEIRGIVRSTLAMNAGEVAEHWIDASRIASLKGDHTPARDLLLAVGAVESPKAGNGDKAGGVQILIGSVLPGLGLPTGSPLTVSVGASPLTLDGETIEDS